VKEYWIVNWQKRSVQLFCRENEQLQLVATLTVDDTLASPMLPDFALPLRQLFAPPL
jgi:Uma2 family endonuclease